jgi:hypothetical protein
MGRLQKWEGYKNGKATTAIGNSMVINMELIPTPTRDILAANRAVV